MSYDLPHPLLTGPSEFLRLPRFHALLLSLTLALSGCADQPRSQGFWNLQSADVVINATPQRPPGAWKVADSPSVMIGKPDPENPVYALWQITGAIRLTTGEVAIANRGTSEIRLYDRNGQFVRAVGRPGEGPGEFTSAGGGLRSIQLLAPDSIAAWDFSKRRMTIFSREGRVLRILNYAHQPEWLDGVTLLEDRRIVGFYQPPVDDVPTEGTTWSGARDYRIVDTLGNLTRIEALPGFPYVAMFRHGEVRPSRQPFGKYAVHSVSRDRLFVGLGDTPELRVYDLNSGPSLTILVQWSPRTSRRVMTSHESLEVDRLVEQGVPRDRRQVFPDSFPALSEVITDSEGYIWVQRYPRPGESITAWDVFDSARIDTPGSWITSVYIPSRMKVWSIGPDYILGSATAQGAEQVLLFSLNRD